MSQPHREQSVWEPADIEKLTSMWIDGSSADDISKALGRRKSRNAVLGKVHRMKLPDRSIDQRAAAIGAAKRGKRKSPLVLPKAQSIVEIEPSEDRREHNGGLIHKVRAARTGQKHRNIAPPMAGNANAKRLILGQGPAELDAPPTPIKGEAFMPLPGSIPVPITEHADGCRWPVGDPALYCNLERATLPALRSGREPTRSVYCKVHDAMSKPPAGKRAAR